MGKSAPNPDDQCLDPGDPAAFARMTNINRRACKRVVPLKVLALGPSRTGTASLRQALIDLGYKDCYHYTCILQENPRDQDMWIEAAEAKCLGKGKKFAREDWDQLLGHCQAITDTPSVMFYKELLEEYPDAKVILTVRDSSEQWYRSIMNTLVPWLEEFGRPAPNLFQRVYRWFTPFEARSYRFMDVVLRNFPMFQTCVYDYHRGTQTGKDWYEKYIEEIKTIVPQDKLLVMNVKQGWDPLCEFLGEEKPLYPFPKKNDSSMFIRNQVELRSLFGQVVRWNIFMIAGSVLAAGLAVVLGVYRYSLFKTSDRS